MTGDGKRGDAVADQLRDKFAKGRRETDLALTELDVRADRRSQDFDEDSSVIMQEALERQRKKESDPPSGVTKQVFSFARTLQSDWAKVALLLGLALIGAVVYLALKLPR